jgi:hypothetical protein
MDNKTLKAQILDRTLSDNSLIFKYEDNKYLCFKYIDEIAKFKNKNKFFINSINEIDLDSFEYDKFLYILDIDELKENIPNCINNLIVVCNKISEDIAVEYVSISKLADWHLKDYISIKLPGLKEEEIDWLVDITKKDIYRLENESNKIKIFPKESQRTIFKLINEGDGYSDLNTLNIFDFTNSIMKRNLSKIKEILYCIEKLDVDAFALIALLLKNFLNLINIQMGIKPTPEGLGLTYNQFKAIGYNCGKYKNEELIKIFEFLTSIDNEVKSGNLDIENEDLISYLICNIIEIQ